MGRNKTNRVLSSGWRVASIVLKSSISYVFPVKPPLCISVFLDEVEVTHCNKRSLSLSKVKSIRNLLMRLAGPWMLNTAACLPEDFCLRKSATTGPSEITVNTSVLTRPPFHFFLNSTWIGAEAEAKVTRTEQNPYLKRLCYLIH